MKNYYNLKKKKIEEGEPNRKCKKEPQRKKNIRIKFNFPTIKKIANTTHKNIKKRKNKKYVRKNKKEIKNKKKKK